MRTPYIDFGDTHEAAVAAYTMDGAVRDSGTPIVICAGLTPGMSGVLAKYMSHGLDTVESIEFNWLTGSTPKRPGVPKAGGSLVEHMIHESTGTTQVLRGGRLERLSPFRVASHKQFPEPVGNHMVYAIGHAEVVTIPSHCVNIEWDTPSLEFSVECEGEEEQYHDTFRALFHLKLL